MSNSNNQSFLSWLVEAYSKQVAPVLNDAMASTVMFVRLMAVNPDAAGPHGVKAIATLVLGGVAIWLLWKSLRALSAVFKRLANVVEGTWEILEAQQAYIRERLGQVARRFIDRLAQPNAMRDLIDWVAVLPRSTMRTMLRRPDGAVEVATQRNFGLLLLAVTAASGVAFVTAVTMTAGSWTPEPPLLWPVALMAGAIYMAIILPIERAIVAPVAAFGRSWHALLAALSAVSVRVVLAWLIASFTALPITALLLRGGIVEVRDQEVELQRKKLHEETASLDAAVLTATRLRRESPTCTNSQAAVTSAQKLVTDAAVSGCRPGLAVCPGRLTAKVQEIHAARIAEAKGACALTAEEAAVFSQSRGALTAQLAGVAPARSPDILASAKVLNSMVFAETGAFFQPVRSTFMLLFGLELAPALLKLARELLRFATEAQTSSKGRGGGKSGSAGANTFRLSTLRRAKQAPREKQDKAG